MTAWLQLPCYGLHMAALLVINALMKTYTDKSPDTYHSVSIDSLPLPVILVSNQSKLLAANCKARHVFGTFKEGRDISTMISNSRFLTTLHEVAESGVGCDCEIVRKKPSKRRFEANMSPFNNSSGQGVFIVFHETTAAFEAEKMRSSFVADVSHELRSPLTTMIATIETLKGSAGSKPDIRARFTDLLAFETNRMHRIVDDLLSLSATESTEHIMPENPVNLIPIVNSVAKVLALKSDSKDMTIKLELDSNLPDILGDKDALYQVIYNLTDNAIKYGPAGTAVTLTATAWNNTVMFATLNFGPQIRKKHIPRLTERFYRADKSRSRDLGGTGLGLAIVKHIVNRHLGKLEITSSEEEGTVFSVTFPKV